jgi:diguanylate cyclase (GGDEF)-like protein
MNDERHHYDTRDLALEAPTPESVPFPHVAPLSTIGGTAAIGVCLWGRLPIDALIGWAATAVLIAALQWHALRGLPRRWGALEPRSQAALLLIATTLGTGLFWGISGIVLLPVDSIPHQAMVALVLFSVIALWLPVFAFVQWSLWLFAVPAVLPMASMLLTSPSAAQTTMGGLLLAAVAAIAVVGRTLERVFDADATARRSLYHHATHDALVGLVNRAEFFRRVQALETTRSQHAVLFIDLDHFKQINDTAGHAIGDELLRQIGALLRQVTRRDDTAARLGGDEFAILMRECSPADATRVAEAIVQRIASFCVRADTGCYRVTASLGIACSASARSSAQIMAAADRACYLAKRGGRNRFAMANDDDLAVTAASVERAA